MANEAPSLGDDPMLATDSRSESDSELVAASTPSNNHSRGYSADFVDDEEVDLPLGDDDSLSNASWNAILPNNLNSPRATPPLPLRREEDDHVGEDATPTVPWEHVASFVKEHGIFLQAALDLLQERDKHAPKVGMMDPVVLKAGPLKKASIVMKGIWKVKYVEIRRGMFSYYENLRDEEKLIRKDIPLQANDCTVRAVKVHPSKAALQLTVNRRSGGAIFELSVGGAKRLWMASSRDERQSWMQTIRNATVGGSLTTSNDHSNHRGRLRVVNPRSPFRHDLRLYLKTQSVLRGATTQAEYTQGLIQLRKERASLQIPVKWIAKEQELLAQQQAQSPSQGQEKSGTGETTNIDGQQAFNEEAVERSIEQLWKDLQRDSVAINGIVYRGDEGLGPQGIMGALAHSILEVSLSPSTMSLSTASSPPPPPPLSPTTTTTETRKSSSGRTGDEEGRKSNGFFGRRTSDEDSRHTLSLKRSSDESERRRLTFKTSSGDTSPGGVDSDTNNDSAPPSPVPSRGPPLTPQPLSPRGALSPSSEPPTKWSDFSEAQALTYARDILLSGNRTRSGGDSYFCINTLFQHPELVVVVPNYGEVEPVRFIVSSDESGVRRNDKAGWISTRSKLQRKWKKLFFVLSEGILSYYERALPRPNGLRGQLHMKDATLNVAKREQKGRAGGKARRFYAISITTKEGKERSIAFESVDRMLDWAYALECVAKVSKSATPGDLLKRLVRRRSSESASDSQSQTVPTAEQAMESHASSLGIDLEKVRERLSQLSRKVSPSVRVQVEASTDYKVSTTDPEGDDQLDTWARVRTTFQQTFRLTGGPGGRILRGEEVVRVTLMECTADEAEAVEDELPSTPRRKSKKGIFRQFSNHEGNPNEPSNSARLASADTEQVAT